MPRVMAISARTLPRWICTRPNLAFITLPSVRNWGTFLLLPWNLARRIVSYRVGSRNFHPLGFAYELDGALAGADEVDEEHL